MRIAVLVKQVPDTWADRRLNEETGLVDRGASPRVIDEISEYAVEAALRIAESAGGEVVAISMGPETATESVKRALEMGAEEGYLVSDPGLAASDIPMTARVLAEMLKRIQPDLVVMGNWSTDGRSGFVPPMVAEYLGLSLLHALDTVRVANGSVQGDRTIDGAHQEIATALPAVISVTERVDPPRVPGLRSVLKARKRPIHRFSLADLGLQGLSARSVNLSAAARPPRIKGPVVPHSDDAVRELVDLLVNRRLIEGKQL